MPTVEIHFTALPAHVRTARLIAVAVARRANVDSAMLDEVRLAVGEACTRAVGLHEQHAPEELVSMALSDDVGRFTVEVRDRGPREAAPPSLGQIDVDRVGDAATLDGVLEPVGALLPPGFGLAVIVGLVDSVEITSAEPTGTRVSMTWPAGAQAAESISAAG